MRNIFSDNYSNSVASKGGSKNHSEAKKVYVRPAFLLPLLNLMKWCKILDIFGFYQPTRKRTRTTFWKKENLFSYFQRNIFQFLPRIKPYFSKKPLDIIEQFELWTVLDETRTAFPINFAQNHLWGNMSRRNYLFRMIIFVSGNVK